LGAIGAFTQKKKGKRRVIGGVSHERSARDGGRLSVICERSKIWKKKRVESLVRGVRYMLSTGKGGEKGLGGKEHKKMGKTGA